MFQSSYVKDSLEPASLEAYEYKTFEKQTFYLPKSCVISEMKGRGTYGIVVAVNDSELQEEYAVKKVITIFADLNTPLRSYREIAILKNIFHPNIIKLHSMTVAQDPESFTELFMTTELMDTDLKRVIYSTQSFGLEEVKYISFQIVKAMAYLHSVAVLHRDLKPGNILIRSDCETKICDFGLAKFNRNSPVYRQWTAKELERSEGKLASSMREFHKSSKTSPVLAEQMTDYMTTRWYRAPEVCFKFDDYDEACDVWSFGCLLAEMLVRQPFLKGANEKHQIELIIDMIGYPPKRFIDRLDPTTRMAVIKTPIGVPQNLSKLFPMLDHNGINMLRSIFCYENRITFDQLLKHPFFDEPYTQAIASNFFDKGVDKGEIIRQLEAECSITATTHEEFRKAIYGLRFDRLH